MLSVAQASRVDARSAPAARRAATVPTAKLAGHAPTTSLQNGRSGVLQRKCACGGDCPRCRSASPIQPKLTINEPGDAFEQEADRVADQLMRMADPRPHASLAPAGVQRKCAACGGEETSKLQTKRDRSSPGLAAATAPPIVHGVRRSAGHPLDAETRAFMEPRFGQDFAEVRVHTNGPAAHSARAIDARAYTVGHDIVFADGQFQPTTSDGQRLLAHELVHVVSQTNCAPYVQRAPAQAGQEGGDFRCGGDPCTTQTTNNTYPTWAGEFIVDKHCVTQGDDGKSNGVDLTMRFKPNANVDAEQIAFVQTAQSKSAGKAVSIYESKGEKEKEAAGKRMIPEGQPDVGTHIDQGPGSRTPLVGMRDVSGQDTSLTAFQLSTSPTLAKPGFHFTKDGKPQDQDAWMHDCPSLPREPVAQQQTLETAALAIAGAQKGIFYGSVTWGWTMGPKDQEATGLPMKVVSKETPSPTFSAAAKLWNQSKTSAGETSIALPQSMYTVAAAVDLWDGPDKRKKIGTLAKGTRVGVTEKSDPKQADWRNVVVVSGSLTAKVGWVQKTDLKAL